MGDEILLHFRINPTGKSNLKISFPCCASLFSVKTKLPKLINVITGSKQSRISVQIQEKPQSLSFRNQFWQQTDLQTNVPQGQVKRCRPQDKDTH